MKKAKIISFIIIIFFFACKNETVKNDNYLKIAGKTMGTTYNITYKNVIDIEIKRDVDNLLKEINQQVSTYIPTSTISLFNKSLHSFSFPLSKKHFLKNFVAAKNISKATNGYFDPTVMPLVNYWGFGYTEKKPVTKVDSIKIDSLLQFVGLANILFNYDSKEGHFAKRYPGVQLDFSAIAKGYAVDKICELFDQREIYDYFVEIGGEIRVKGKNPKGKWWSVGINTPKENAKTTDYQEIVELTNRALATSGNYRNFYEVNGNKYSHTINPKTGFPERNNLLSASVFAQDCMTADAYATAFMAMGLDKAFNFAKNKKEIDAWFIYNDETGNLKIAITDKNQNQ